MLGNANRWLVMSVCWVIEWLKGSNTSEVWPKLLLVVRGDWKTVDEALGSSEADVGAVAGIGESNICLVSIGVVGGYVIEEIVVLPGPRRCTCEARTSAIEVWGVGPSWITLR